MVTIAANPQSRRLQCLIRHVEDVQHDCQVLGTRLIERGEAEAGRLLIANGFSHDHSKFEGIEWEHLTVRDDPLFAEAWLHHVGCNKHHPEYWAASGGVHLMDRVSLAEMVCDWHSRSSELDGGGLRWWIDHDASRRFGFSSHDESGRQIMDLVELLLDHWN